MIELLILEFLKEKLDVPVYLERPNLFDENFVFFEKTGSGRKNSLNNSPFAFQSYGSTLYEAASLNERVKQSLFDMETLNEISKVKLNSDYNFTDTELKQYRYQAVFDIYHY